MERSAYEIVVGPRGRGDKAAIVFKLFPDATAPLSLEDAQNISGSLCGDCPFNPKNQPTGRRPFVSTCDTFNGQDLQTTVTLPTEKARTDLVQRAKCHPTAVRKV